MSIRKLINRNQEEEWSFWYVLTWSSDMRNRCELFDAPCTLGVGDRLTIGPAQTARSKQQEHNSEGVGENEKERIRERKRWNRVDWGVVERYVILTTTCRVVLAATRSRDHCGRFSIDFVKYFLLVYRAFIIFYLSRDLNLYFIYIYFS